MKRGKKMLCFVLVLVLCVGIYIVTGKLNSTGSDTVNETAGSFDLTAKKSGDAAGIAWTNGGETLSFTKAGDAWTLDGEDGYPVSSGDVQALADELVGMKATRKITDVSDPGLYGLNDESFAVKITWSDGTSTTWTEGAETPFADGYYLKVSDQDPAMFTVQSSLSSAFAKAKGDLTAEESIPAIGAAAAVRIGDTLAIRLNDEPTTVDPDLLWTDEATGRVLDTSAAEDLAADITGITFASLVSANASADDLTAAGLDDEHAVILSVTDKDGAACTFLLGGTDENGAYYIRLKDSAQIHTAAAADVSALPGMTAGGLYSKALFTLPYDNVKEAVLAAGDISYTITGKTETADSDTAETAETADTSARDKTLWEAVTALTGTGFTDEAGNGGILLTVSVTSDTGAVGEFSVREYDADEYIAEMNGYSMTVSAEKTDKLIRLLRQTR